MPNCALCGTPAPPPFRAPAPEGAPDLDGRPGEPTRSTLRRWLQTCRTCAACAPALSALPPNATPDRTRPPFERWAALVAGTPAEPEALLQAAWAADDAAQDAGTDATALRRRAAAAWPASAEPHSILRLADARIAAGDTGRHLLSSALRPPARTPHVTHGRQAPSFWSRLLGSTPR